ncbi:hypothetical protein ACHAWF_013095 [Thalassiosira exigua]
MYRGAAPSQSWSSAVPPAAAASTSTASRGTASNVRVVTFDLDNTVWKTSETLTDANDALAHWLREECGVEERSEARMGRLFKEDAGRYIGVVDADGEYKSGGSTSNARDERGEDDADLVQNVGRTELNAGDKGDGVHISSAKRKPVFLTRLRKDAIRSLLVDAASGTSDVDSDVEARVDEGFDLWSKARCASISRNLAPGAASTLATLRSRLRAFPVDDDRGRVCVGAITDGNSNPDGVPALAGAFDFVIRAEDVGFSKPDARVYKAAVAAVMAKLEEDGGDVEAFFLGDEVDDDASDGAAPGGGYLTTSHTSSGTPRWEDVDPEAVDAFAEAVGPWWVHVGDDFFKDVVAAGTMGMRTVWSRELVGGGAANDGGGGGAKVDGEEGDAQERRRSVADLVADVSNSDQRIVTMSVGASDYLGGTLREEFADAVLDRFEDLGDLLERWHREGTAARGGGEVGASGDVAAAGAVVPATVPAAPSPSLAEVPANDDGGGGASPRRRFCAYCGERLPESARFCPSCGERRGG